ncbi:hypothetical protein CONLIGDRAFT_243494 [Coniochaeta ligniaria NRRL 30616]|uniref:Uncharacterized protein n=1 Tax=Coniochaeta ligniaria NRRL 30616 TaxID=1408157 RepID=A0A1J7JR65_9PEZI|nr:hypothetical protein CONLIGDRAFT_243494 [Coniochaeta ligniaria NRRL 30616]
MLYAHLSFLERNFTCQTEHRIPFSSSTSASAARYPRRGLAYSDCFTSPRQHFRRLAGELREKAQHFSAVPSCSPHRLQHRKFFFSLTCFAPAQQQQQLGSENGFCGYLQVFLLVYLMPAIYVRTTLLFPGCLWRLLCLDVGFILVPAGRNAKQTARNSIKTPGGTWIYQSRLMDGSVPTASQPVGLIHRRRTTCVVDEPESLELSSCESAFTWVRLGGPGSMRRFLHWQVPCRVTTSWP